MRIKKYFLPCFLPIIAVLCFLLLIAPAFADIEKVDDAELAQANVSVTGASDKDWNVSAVSAGGTLDKTILDSSPPDSKASGFSMLSSLGPEMWTYMQGAGCPTCNGWGLITGSRSR